MEAESNLKKTWSLTSAGDNPLSENRICSKTTVYTEKQISNSRVSSAKDSLASWVFCGVFPGLPHICARVALQRRQRALAPTLLQTAACSRPGPPGREQETLCHPSLPSWYTAVLVQAEWSFRHSPTSLALLPALLGGRVGDQSV